MKAEEFATTFNTKAYSDIKSMVIGESIDLIIVCSAHPYHKEPAIEAAKAGSDVLVEKPLASDLQDCDDIIAACKQNNVRLGVISQTQVV